VVRGSAIEPVATRRSCGGDGGDVVGGRRWRRKEGFGSGPPQSRGREENFARLPKTGPPLESNISAYYLKNRSGPRSGPPAGVALVIQSICMLHYLKLMVGVPPENGHPNLYSNKKK
jgi:hypothetical protein